MLDENEKIQELVSNSVLAVAEGIPFYDIYTECSFRGLMFHNKTVEEWLEEVKLPEIPEESSFIELEEFNSKYMALTELVMRNHSISKVGFNYAILHYKKALSAEVSRLSVSYTSQNKRLPSRESLESMAKNNIIDVYTAYKISALFVELWESQFEKIKLASYRLSAMNHIKALER